jgi:hypothetical protein
MIEKLRRKVQTNLLKHSMAEFFYSVCWFNDGYILAIVDAYFYIAGIDPTEPNKEIDKWDGRRESVRCILETLEKYIPDISINRMNILTKMFYGLVLKDKEEESYAAFLPVNEALMEASKDCL